MKKPIFISLLLITTCLLVFSSCEEENEEDLNKEPTISITNPTSGSKIPKDTTITITVNAEDKDGKVSEVRFYLDNSGFASVKNFPFKHEWNLKEVTTGKHILKAETFDDNGASGKDTVQIFIGEVPIAGFTADSTKMVKDSTIQFKDESNGNPTDWNWDFGDGNTSSEKNPIHSYSSTGTYTVVLKVSNEYGNDTKTKTDYITIGVPPTVAFQVDQAEIKSRTTVNFTDKSTGNPTRWQWDFGDDSSSTQQNPSHTYVKGGKHTVKLTASNDYGSNTLTKTDFIVVSPSAAFSVNQSEIKEGTTVNFTGESTGDPTSWHWDFGDGNTSNKQNPSHTYVKGGVHTVELTVSNDLGSDVKIGKDLMRVYKIKFNAGSKVYTSPAIGSDGTIYLGTKEGYFAVNPEGTQKWQFDKTFSKYYSPAIGSDGTIYLGGNGFYAINPDGSQKWQYNFGGYTPRIRYTPSIGSDGTLHVGANDKLYAIKPDGTSKWQMTSMEKEVASSSSIGIDGTVYVKSGDCYIYATNPGDGAKKWRFGLECMMFGTPSSPAIGSDSIIYIGSYDNHLYAIKPNGKEKWQFETGGKIYSSPAIGPNGIVYVGSNDNYLYAINPNGTQKWRFETGGKIKSSPAIGTDGTIYVGSEDNYLYAISPNGNLKWRFLTENGIFTSPVIGTDGTLYFGSGDYLYGIQSNNQLADTPWPMIHHDPKHTGKKD